MSQICPSLFLPLSLFFFFASGTLKKCSICHDAGRVNHLPGQNNGGHNNGSEPAMTRVSETGWLTTACPRLGNEALALAHWLLSLREMQHGVTQQHAPRAGRAHNARNNFLSSSRAVLLLSLSLFFRFSFIPAIPLPLSSSFSLVLCRHTPPCFLSPSSSTSRSRRASLGPAPLPSPINDLPDVPPTGGCRIGHGFAAPMARC